MIPWKKRRQIREGSMAVTVLIYIIVSLACLAALYPFYYVLVQSFASPEEVMKGTAYLWPKRFYFESYSLLLKDAKLWRALAYSLLYVAAGTILNVITSCIAAYPLCCKGLAHRKFWVMFVLLPMYFSGGMIPTFLQMTKLGLYNTIWAAILPLPCAVDILHIILARTGMAQVPDALRESAVIDGAGHLRILRSIMIPLIKPVLAVIAIYSVVNIWNNYMNMLLYVPDTNLHSLQFYLYRVMIQQTVDMSSLTSTLDLESVYAKVLSNYQLKYAMIIVASLPMIATYPFFQKYFIKGIMLGSLKG